MSKNFLVERVLPTEQIETDKKRNYEYPILLLLFCIFLAFSFYKLTESPKTWYDEGILTQVAMNIAAEGKYMIQIAPEKFVSAGFVSTGYPVIYPVGLAFHYFGMNLFVARFVTVIYLLLFMTLFYILARRLHGVWGGILAASVMASFAPLFGHGRNVLGEIPGLFFLLIVLYQLSKIAQQNFTASPYSIAITGFATGLAVSTKPIFMLLLPALFVAYLWSWPRETRSIKKLVAFFICFLIPVGIWVVTQFDNGDSIASMLSIYSNPAGYSPASLLHIILGNVRRFFTEWKAIYMLVLWGAWVISFGIRWARGKKPFEIAELVAILFATFVLAAYVRTEGWYRYFFLAEVMAFLYLPRLLHTWAIELGRWIPSSTKFLQYATYVFLVLLVLGQSYYLGAHSWIVADFTRHRTEGLENYFLHFDKSKSVFIYNVPEVALFANGVSYYQYLEVKQYLVVGQNEIRELDDGRPDFLILFADEWEKTLARFPRYQKQEVIDEYVIAAKKPA
ncbi:MAG: hypothetical protein A3C12_03060 [Candidatus Sungbacteria bacterium RIFCSPHIGHO2_02_FULL_49_20]|uniref:Glycosyltransferase RgtA/B/C/D-like domain-containing protein n=1 Tax=Candidatus Sungbacteria bacterium RIFCSPHIGHO2_02_FULL_49_20 TaxID=1802272 RepID=A0A1G2KPV6_9BACT|nr:MAG: hypothetical protein A3C12_03060 [Candidatus Sungbacteria bacterium RIFCSPHIGHO2_02_FULL_49_20]